MDPRDEGTSPPDHSQDERRALDEALERDREELREAAEELRQPDDSPAAARLAIEAELLADALESTPGRVAGTIDEDRGRRDVELDEALSSIFDDPSTVAHEGRGEDLDPAVWPEEWTAPRGDQIDEAADVDDPVEALEVGALWAGTEADATGDATELADGAAPAVPEEAAVVDRAGAPVDGDVLGLGVDQGVDLDRLEEASLEDLAEAELVALDVGDPETAALIAAELERRHKR